MSARNVQVESFQLAVASGDIFFFLKKHPIPTIFHLTRELSVESSLNIGSIILRMKFGARILSNRNNTTMPAKPCTPVLQYSMLKRNCFVKKNITNLTPCTFIAQLTDVHRGYSVSTRESLKGDW